MHTPQRNAVPAHIQPTQIGWHIGTSTSTAKPVDLWAAWDRTTGVFGQQGCGKTLDVLIPALLQAPGAALMTLTKPQDMFLTLDHRTDHGPVRVLDPFGLTPGIDPFLWDPIAGCSDPTIAERRGKAFATIAAGKNEQSSGAKFYAAEATKVLAGFFHAAALCGGTMDTVLDWISSPGGENEPIQILQTNPHAAPHWSGLVDQALHGDPRTTSNTRVTVHQAVEALFQPAIRTRCTPTVSTQATDIHDLIRNNGTIYVVGREDPYQSVTPFMTAAVEAVFDAALDVAHRSYQGRLTPPFFACLDELPSTAPIPTLITRAANERALGINIMYATQSLPQLRIALGTEQAKSLIALTNNLLVFGGSKDTAFNKDLSDLMGTVKYDTASHNIGVTYKSSQVSHTTEAVIRPDEIRQLEPGHALLITDGLKPIITKLKRCIDGPDGRALLRSSQKWRDIVTAAHAAHTTPTQPHNMLRPTGS